MKQAKFMNTVPAMRLKAAFAVFLALLAAVMLVMAAARVSKSASSPAEA